MSVVSFQQQQMAAVNVEDAIDRFHDSASNKKVLDIIYAQRLIHFKKLLNIEDRGKKFSEDRYGNIRHPPQIMLKLQIQFTIVEDTSRQPFRSFSETFYVPAEAFDINSKKIAHNYNKAIDGVYDQDIFDEIQEGIEIYMENHVTDGNEGMITAVPRGMTYKYVVSIYSDSEEPYTITKHIRAINNNSHHLEIPIEHGKQKLNIENGTILRSDIKSTKIKHLDIFYFN